MKNKFFLIFFLLPSLLCLGLTRPDYDQIKSKPIVSITEYGCIPNDGIDDTASAQACLDNNSIVFFGSGTWDIYPVIPPPLVYGRNASDAGNGCLHLYSSQTVILAPGSILKVTPNQYDSYGALLIIDKDNVTITGGGIIQGEGTLHAYGATTTVPYYGPAALPGAPDFHESGHGIFCVGGKRILIEDISIIGCTGDGIDLNHSDPAHFPTSGSNRYCEDVLIRNVHLINNRRNGLSVESSLNGRFEDLTIIGTGTVVQTNPKSGIDIEPAGTFTTVYHNSFSRCKSNNNVESGFLVWYSEIIPTTVSFDTCTAENNLYGFHATGSSDIQIVGCLANNNSAGISVTQQIPYTPSNARIDRNRVTNSNYGINLSGTTAEGSGFGSITNNTLASCAIGITAGPGRCFNVSNNLLDNCGLASVYTDVSIDVESVADSIFNGNIIYYSKGHGFQIYGSTRTVFSNNYVSRIPEAVASISGLACFFCYPNTSSNNLLFTGNTMKSQAWEYGMYFTASESKMTVIGNDFYGSTATPSNWIFDASSDLVSLLTDNASGTFQINNHLSLSNDGVVKWGDGMSYGALSWQSNQATIFGQIGKALSLGSDGIVDRFVLDTAGNIAATGSLRIERGLRLASSSAGIPSIVSGMIYFNGTDSHFYGWNGTSWKQLDNL